MTLLTVIQDAAGELGLVKPSSVVSATTDQVAQQLLGFFNRGGREMRSEHDWPELVKEYSFDLADGQAAYAMPGDFERFGYSTFWDRDNSWEMAGPITQSDWAFLKSGVAPVGLKRRFRFKGFATNQFFIDPVPTSGDAGTTLVFEYYSKNWLRPRLWVASTSFSSDTYCFYNGNYYSKASGSTTGTTPPTHTTGSVSDGGVTWTYYSGAYERATLDTDVSHLSEDLLTLDIKWRYRQARGLDGWELMKAERDAVVSRLAAANAGAGNINLNSSRYIRSLPYPITPETGFG